MSNPTPVSAPNATPIRLRTAALAVLGCLTVTGCASDAREGVDDILADPPGRSAFADLGATMGSNVHGEVTFESTADGLRVTADVYGLTPGLHGFHIHERGDCSAPDASSAGGHFSPDGNRHGAPDAAPDQRHAGDLGNLRAGRDGHAHFEAVLAHLSLTGERGVIGRSAVVHARADDFTSQPSGDAGGRVACGVIVPE